MIHFGMESSLRRVKISSNKEIPASLNIFYLADSAKVEDDSNKQT